ncbi:MAG: hypothetical protein U5L96_21485 [Owenweeksia sp.]|nr:hypothetical protein [Owenweeksia sp.]
MVAQVQGLTISKKLVQLQHGRIDVESEIREGSCFNVFIEYGLTDKENYSGKFDLDQVEINLEGRSLLLIDDDSMNHVLLKPAFERWGLQFDSAYNGQEGVEKARARAYEFMYW